MTPTTCWMSVTVRTGYSSKHCSRSAKAELLRRTPCSVNVRPASSRVSDTPDSVLSEKGLSNTVRIASSTRPRTSAWLLVNPCTPMSST